MSEQIASLESKVVNLESKVVSLESKVVSLESKVASLEDKIQSERLDFHTQMENQKRTFHKLIADVTQYRRRGFDPLKRYDGYSPRGY